MFRHMQRYLFLNSFRSIQNQKKTTLTTHAFSSSYSCNAMAARSLTACARPRMAVPNQHLPQIPIHPQCIARVPRIHQFSSSARLCQQQGGYKEPFRTRLRKALGETKIKWYPIPVGLGIGFLGLGQLYRVNEREKAKLALDDDGYSNFTGSDENSSDEGQRGRPKRRERIRPTGPWSVSLIIKIYVNNANNAHRQVQVMSTLPLKAMSRLWGKFNELQIPYYLRVPGFKLYSWVFGVKYANPPKPVCTIQT